MAGTYPVTDTELRVLTNAMEVSDDISDGESVE